MPDADLNTPTRYPVKIDLPGLIHLLAKSLYAEADIFIREMIQNAHDSIQRRVELQGEQAPAGVIRILPDDRGRTMTFSDNGCGLTESEIHDYLATIGRSGTDEFRKQLLARGRHAEVNVIGRFGIGLLSAFVAARRVEVETLSIQPDSPALRWVSEGQSDYELSRSNRTDEGTTVTLHIADDHRDLLDPERLRTAVKTYADFIPFAIYVDDGTAPTNAIDAPWHKSYASDDQRLAEYWSFANRRFPDIPLAVIPVDVSQPYRVQGILYISDQHLPDVASAGLVDIYQARMFITAGNRDLLPPWARFVRGVIDSPDLSPTAARDAIQQDAAFRGVKESLGRAIMNYLRDLANTDRQRFDRLLDHHSYYVKGMAVEHDDFFDAICDIVPFETNRGLMSLQRYLDESPRLTGQRTRTIHYFSERGSATQFYMLCNARQLLAVNAGFVFEESFLRKYVDRHTDVRLHLLSVAGSDFLFEPLKPDEAKTFHSLERDFERTMPHAQSRAQISRFSPTALPAVTVLTKSAKAEMELRDVRNSAMLPEYVRQVVQDVLGDKPHIPVVLYLNADNAAIQQLAQMANSPFAEDEVYRAAILAVYNNAILLAQHLMTPENAQAAFNSSNHIISLLTSQSEELTNIKSRLTAAELRIRELDQPILPDARNEGKPQHIVCFAALPFKDSEMYPFYSLLFPALRRVLEMSPYCWQVARADDQYWEAKVEDNVLQWLYRADTYIADISSQNANVMMELGFMQWADPARKRPRIVLYKEEAAFHLSDLGGFIKVQYPNARGEKAIDVLIDALAEQFAKISAVQKLNRQKEAHYLSPLLLQAEFEQSEETAQMISRKFVSIEAFLAASVDDILARLPELRRGAAMGLQADLGEWFQKSRGQT